MPEKRKPNQNFRRNRRTKFRRATGSSPAVSEESLSLWIPKTELGRDVFDGKITDIDEIFLSGKKIKEPQIVDKLLPNLESDIILIGGSPGKGGGIRRTPTARTVKMHRSGRRYRMSAMAIVGNKNGYIGFGKAVAQDHREAIQKAIEIAKLNVIPIRRGCGSWECGCGKGHSIPFSVKGKKGSVVIILKPAPKGIGLCISDENKKIMKLAGITDIWSKSRGNTGSRSNVVMAIFDAFKNLNKTKSLVDDEIMETKKPDELKEREKIKDEKESKEDKKESAKESEPEMKKKKEIKDSNETPKETTIVDNKEK